MFEIWSLAKEPRPFACKKMFFRTSCNRRQSRRGQTWMGWCAVNSWQRMVRFSNQFPNDRTEEHMLVNVCWNLTRNAGCFSLKKIIPSQTRKSIFDYLILNSMTTVFKFTREIWWKQTFVMRNAKLRQWKIWQFWSASTQHDREMSYGSWISPETLVFPLLKNHPFKNLRRKYAFCNLVLRNMTTVFKLMLELY